MTTSDSGFLTSLIAETGQADMQSPQPMQRSLTTLCALPDSIAPTWHLSSAQMPHPEHSFESISAKYCELTTDDAGMPVLFIDLKTPQQQEQQLQM
jgi:hypothetical protein